MAFSPDHTWANVRVDRLTKARWRAAAKAKGMSLVSWIKHTLDQAVTGIQFGGDYHAEAVTLAGSPSPAAPGADGNPPSPGDVPVLGNDTPQAWYKEPITIAMNYPGFRVTITKADERCDNAEVLRVLLPPAAT